MRYNLQKYAQNAIVRDCSNRLHQSLMMAMIKDFCQSVSVDVLKDISNDTVETAVQKLCQNAMFMFLLMA